MGKTTPITVTVTEPILCTNNFDCPINQVCSGGTCIDHEPCPTGTHWDETQKACVADTPCTVDSDCPTGQICQNGICITPPPPFDWLQIALLATLAVAAVLVVAGVATTKD